MPLELPTPAALPQLATDCVLVGHERKADIVWTRQQFLSICEHMHNGNDPQFFLTAYRREADGAPCFAKAKKARVDSHANWAGDTITGRAKKPAGIGFYPRN